MASKYGEISTSEGTLTLTQQPYPEGGCFEPYRGWRFEGNWYQAAAVAADGNDYRVYWTDVDWTAEDEADAADWDNPDYICEI